MRIRHFKKIRALGVAESFRKNVGGRSILAGVVMRSDLTIDGVAFGFATVGGMDATDAIVKLYNSLEREDVNVLLISGSVISWFNVIDLNRVSAETGLPLICLTYEESEGIEGYFKKYFPQDWEERVRVHRSNGERVKIKLATGYDIFIIPIGLEIDEARRVLDAFASHGRYPEPIRVARLLARAALRAFSGTTQPNVEMGT